MQLCTTSRAHVARIGAAGMVAALAACGGSPVPSASSGTTLPSTTPVATASPLERPTGGHLYWLLTMPALQSVLSEPGAARLFDTPTTFLGVSRENPTVPQGWDAIPTVIYPSYRGLESAFANRSILPGVRAVVYDNENWQSTPRDEQRDPARFEMLAAKLIHGHGLLYIAAPAVDLVDVLEPGSGPVFPRYLALNIAADAARHADAVVIQAQGSEDEVSKFAGFVSAAATQARSVNPHVIVLAGISTSPSGKDVAASALDTSVDATRSAVDGYWLNIPAPGGTCLKCTVARPDLAIGLIQHLNE